VHQNQAILPLLIHLVENLAHCPLGYWQTDKRWGDIRNSGGLCSINGRHWADTWVQGSRYYCPAATQAHCAAFLAQPFTSSANDCFCLLCAGGSWECVLRLNLGTCCTSRCHALLRTD
jgi:hypothetical protein